MLGESASQCMMQPKSCTCENIYSSAKTAKDSQFGTDLYAIESGVYRVADTVLTVAMNSLRQRTTVPLRRKMPRGSISQKMNYFNKNDNNKCDCAKLQHPSRPHYRNLNTSRSFIHSFIHSYTQSRPFIRVKGISEKLTWLVTTHI